MDLSETLYAFFLLFNRFNVWYFRYLDGYVFFLSLFFTWITNKHFIWTLTIRTIRKRFYPHENTYKWSAITLWKNERIFFLFMLDMNMNNEPQVNEMLATNFHVHFTFTRIILHSHTETQILWEHFFYVWHWISLWVLFSF